jgi:hypothetical protein
MKTQELESSARSVLSLCPVPELRQLKVEREENALCLLGSLSTWYHKQLAQETLRRVCGNQVRIKNLTQVI